MKYTLVLVRHGESTWNDENRFTGWYDCPLSEKGLEEAHAGAKLLKDEGYNFDVAYTSTLQRAIKTLWIILEEMHLMYIPIVNTYRLNERHYGGTYAQSFPIGVALLSLVVTVVSISVSLTGALVDSK